MVSFLLDHSFVGRRLANQAITVSGPAAKSFKPDFIEIKKPEYGDDIWILLQE